MFKNPPDTTRRDGSAEDSAYRIVPDGVVTLAGLLAVSTPGRSPMAAVYSFGPPQ
jgi:hypothetical protein